MLSSESYISLDQVDLEVVLLNLVNNAKDAIGSAQGVIDISSYQCEPDADRVSKPGLAEQPWLCLCVKDNGMGMSVDQLSRVLDPFFTTKPVGQGTGLGLSETQGLVSRAGGYITINSEEGEGAEICVHLPLFQTDDK
jgi:signal transduction histidine kinase